MGNSFKKLTNSMGDPVLELFPMGRDIVLYTLGQGLSPVA